ncbi:MAG: 4-hydroxy-tetrahydrodipicolinate reductase [Candidatus Omnitrophica bacterium]|nr:4-hydroxy-tetrahydrodipicolinate reductase [Candidatus Omnitrophota bacterium]
MVRIAVNGAAGRMGQRIMELAGASAEFQVAGGFDEKKNKLSKDALSGQGVLIDFSSPNGTLEAIAAAQKAGWGLAVGTTGLDSSAEKALEAAAKTIPVVRSSNMSVGVNLILELLTLAAQKLGNDFDIEITEAHHRHKKDAPSGTALMLAEAIAKAKGWDLKKALRYRQEGKTDKERSNEEIGMQVIRAGEIVGDHTVLFGGPAETIEITHRAQSRDTFALGALAAALFLSKKKNGLYTMTDVLKK